MAMDINRLTGAIFIQILVDFCWVVRWGLRDVPLFRLQGITIMFPKGRAWRFWVASVGPIKEHFIEVGQSSLVE